MCEVDGSLNTDPERGAGRNIPKRRIPDPFEDENWRSLRWLILFLLSLLAGALDPLFIYIREMDDKDMCVRLNKKLGIIAIVFCKCADMVHSFFWLLCHEDHVRIPLKSRWLWIVKKCGCTCALEHKTEGEGDEGSVRLMRDAREADDAFAHICSSASSGSDDHNHTEEW